MTTKQHWIQKFTEHPASVGESYGEHFLTAMGFSLSLFRAALVCAVHALLPFLFVKTGSDSIRDLYGRMVAHRTRGVANDLDDTLNTRA
jgi:hypothetical protein